MAETFGNRCGHDRSNPVLYPPGLEPHGHGTIAMVIEALEQKYFDPDDFFMGRTSGPRKSNGRQFILQQARSEIRESSVRVGKTMMHFMDIDTLTIQTQRQHGPGGIDLKYICRVTEMSPHQVSAVIRDFTEMGYLKTKLHRRRRPDGSYEKWPATRWFTWSFFRALGCELKLKQDQNSRAKKDRKTKRLAAEPAADSSKGQGSQRVAEQLVYNLANTRPLTARVTAPRPRVTAPQPRAVEGPTNIEKRKRWNYACMKLRAEHPEWDVDEIRTKAWDYV